MISESLLLIFIFLGLATVLQTLSGFGFGLMVVSSFTLFGLLPLTGTTFLVSVLSLFNSISIVAKNTHLVHRRAFWLILCGGIPFMLIGFGLLEYLSTRLSLWLNVFLGIAILLCCLLLLVKREKAASGKSWGFVTAGTLGGLLGGLFSTFGPPIVFQCYRQSWPVHEIRFTLLAVFSVTSLIRVAIIPLGTLPANTTLLTTLFAIPLVLAFTRVGRLVAARVSPAMVRGIALIMLMLSGITLIVKHLILLI